MIVSSSVFLLSLTFCGLHSIHCTCYVPCDDHQSTYFLYLPLNTYLLFSWSHPVHWPLSLLACLSHLCIWILTLTFLFFPLRSWMLTFSHSNQGRLADYHLWQLGSFFDRFCVVVSVIFVSPAHYKQAIFFSYLLCLEPATSSTKAQHTVNCASQTAVMMWGIIFVYML